MNKKICIGSLVRFKENHPDTAWIGIVINIMGPALAASASTMTTMGPKQIIVHWPVGHLWIHDIEAVALI